MKLEESPAEAVERARSTRGIERHVEELCDANPPPTPDDQHNLLCTVATSRGKLFRDLHTCPETLDPTLERLRGIYAGDMPIMHNMRISTQRLTVPYYRMQIPARLARVAEVVSGRDLADAIEVDGDTITDALGGLPFQTKVVKATIIHGSANHSERPPKNRRHQRTRGVRHIHQVQKRYDTYTGNVWEASCRNARLVRWMVRKFIKKGVSFGQLFQEGMIIAHRATDYFDLANDAGAQFQTYLKKALRSGLHGVLQGEWRRPERALSFQNKDGESVMAVELTHDFREWDPAHRDAIMTEWAAIEPFLKELTPRERDTLYGRYGLGMHHGVSHTQAEMAVMHHVTPAAIQQTEQRALQKIRQQYEKIHGEAPVLQ